MNVPSSDGTGAAGEEEGIRLRGGSNMYDHHHQGDSESPVDEEEEEEDMVTSEAVGGASGASQYLRQPTQPGSSAAASPHTILNTMGMHLFSVLHFFCTDPL